MRSPWLVTGLLLGLLASTTALAQDGQPADVAREHFRRGEAAYQKGSYALAISEWQAAYAADPRPRIQYNIYQAYERLGQLQEGAAALERYLSTADPDDPYYSDATARMAALQQRLQATGIRLMGGVEGASINVSGHDWGRLPRPDKIPVQPGNHRIVIALAGYRDFVANVVVPPGQVVDVAVQLEASAEQPAPAETRAPDAATTARASDQGEGGGKVALYVTAGVLGRRRDRLGDLDGRPLLRAERLRRRRVLLRRRGQRQHGAHGLDHHHRGARRRRDRRAGGGAAQRGRR